MTLPPHQSKKSLANIFASCFNQKIKRICDVFHNSHSTVIQPMCTHPNLSCFYEVSENEVLNIFQIRDPRQVRRQMTDEVAILVANALVSRLLDYCNSTGVCPVSTCANCSVFETHLLGLSQTVTSRHGHLLFSHNSTGFQLNFAVSSNLPL